MRKIMFSSNRFRNKSILTVAVFALLFFSSAGSVQAAQVNCAEEVTPKSCNENRELFRDCIDSVNGDPLFVMIFCGGYYQLMENCAYCQALCGPGGEQPVDQCGTLTPSDED